MATFQGGIGSPFPQQATAAADHGVGATGTSAASSAADVAPISHEVAASATTAPFVGGLGSPVATSSAVESLGGMGAPVQSHVEAAAPVAWFAPAAHVDASGIQWFADAASNGSLGSPTMQSAALGTDGIGIGAKTVSSVFGPDSGHGWDGGIGDGSYAMGALPFTHETSFDDMPIYTASADTPWIFAADFTGDGWFFV
jgi:hypothetical protein